jgi:hypothetical protein
VIRAVRSVVGVSDHGGWAIFVVVGEDGSLLDRRRVPLIADDLPALPYHHDGQKLPVDAAAALVDCVRASAEAHARTAIDGIAKDIPHLSAVALRQCPPLPPTVAERLRDYRSRNVADWVMYRQAVATAADARGWTVHWYDPKRVFEVASRALGVDSLDRHFRNVRRAVGPPWTQDHRLAMAAALATT